MMDSMKIVETVMEYDDDDDVNNHDANAVSESGVVFHGFEFLFKQVLDIEDQLLCSEVQDEADEKFDDLKKSFESFQSKIRALSLQVKRKKHANLRQLTIHDMLKN